MSLAPVTWINGRAGRATRRQAGPTGGQESRVTWVYAIAGDLGSGQIAGVCGVGGEPVREVRESDLTAVVGSVDAGPFGAGARARLLADLNRAEQFAQAHHRVVACVAADGPVLPLRLATVYPDDSTVRDLLARRRDEFAATLESFRGAEEWGVKVYLGDEHAAPTATRRAGGQGRPATAAKRSASRAAAVRDAEAGALGKGGARDTAAAAGEDRRGGEDRCGGEDRRGGEDRHPGVLSHSGNQPAGADAGGLAGRARAWQSVEAWADAVDRALRSMAIAARRRQPPGPRLARPGGWLALNGAYLLDSSRAAEFAAAARALARTCDGAWSDLSGPWPPYSFADSADGPPDG